MMLGVIFLIKYLIPMKKKQIYTKSLPLLYAYIMSIVLLLGVYVFDEFNKRFLFIVFFLSVLLLNRILNQYQKQKGKYINFLYFSEFSFLIFLFLFFLLKEKYFHFYQLLILPAIVLSIIQGFSLKIPEERNKP